MQKRVIITGASGPLGVVLTQECIKREIEVLAVVRPGSSKRKDIPDNPLVKIVELDICDIEQLESYGLGQFDTCFHLAWTHTGDAGREDPLLQTENIQHTLKTAKCAKGMGCSVFVGAGSQAEYGRANCKVNELSETHPDTWYGRTKLAAGRLVMDYCRQNGVRCNWIRIFSVYGPYENEYVLSAYMTQMLLAGQEPVLTPCEQIWDYVYCEDAGRALVRIGEAAPESGVYCLGSGSARPLKEYVTMIRDAIDSNLPLGMGKKPYGENQIMHLEADISKLRQDIGDVITTPFEEGVRKTVSWYRGKREP